MEDEEALFRKLEEELATSAPEGGGLGFVSRKLTADPTLRARQEGKKRLDRKRVIRMKKREKMMNP